MFDVIFESVRRVIGEETVGQMFLDTGGTLERLVSLPILPWEGTANAVHKFARDSESQSCSDRSL